jgi:HSP20 family molecular chaperone IbpA
MEVTGAEMKDGMLNIDIDRIVPEDKKPKEIAIKVAKK